LYDRLMTLFTSAKNPYFILLLYFQF
jgi:hypothetical protein